MFIPIRFRTSIQLPISELHGDFDEILLLKLQDELEGKCSRFGFIKPDTLIIEKRSCGKFIKQHFNGYVSYEVICRSDVCNPAKNSRVEAVVKNKNALGILAESDIVIHGKNITILDIIVPRRAAGIVSEIDLDELNIGDRFNVMVMGKSYQLNDKKISIIGKGVQTLSDKTETTEALAEDLEEGSDTGEAESDEEDDQSESPDDDKASGGGDSDVREIEDLDLYGGDDELLGGLIGGADDDEEEGSAEDGSDAEEEDGGGVADYDEY